MRALKLLCIVLVLQLVLCVQSLQASQPGLDGHGIIQQQMNSLQSERLRLKQTFGLILAELQTETSNSHATTPNSTNNSIPQLDLSRTLENLQKEGADLFLTLDKQLETLEAQLRDSKTTIGELQNSQQNCLLALKAAQGWSQQIGDRLQFNNEDLAAAYDDLDMLDKQNADLKIQSTRLKEQARRNGFIGFAFGGVGFGAGVPLMAEGMKAGNSAMMWTGASAVIGTTGIWLLGHYVFNWW
jgi:chromosome segregation ATPase